jgi:hypothetical protein
MMAATRHIVLFFAHGALADQFVIDVKHQLLPPCPCPVLPDGRTNGQGQKAEQGKEVVLVAKVVHVHAPFSFAFFVRAWSWRLLLWCSASCAGFCLFFYFLKIDKINSFSCEQDIFTFSPFFFFLFPRGE